MRLMLGDCIERMKEITDGSVDLVLTDPPYGTTACKWDSIIPFEPMWKELWRVLKPGRAVVLMSAQPFTSALVMSQPEAFRHEWVWHKNKSTGHLNAKKRPMRAHEDILVFCKGVPLYNPQMTFGHKPVNAYTRLSNGDCYGSTRTQSGGGATSRYPRSVQDFAVVNNDDPLKKHATQKPVALMEYLIRTYSDEGDTILDFTMGSGTTGVACLQTSRNFIGIENNEDYFRIAAARLSYPLPRKRTRCAR